MQQFKILPDGFKEIKKQILTRTIPIMLVAVTVGLVIATINSKDKSGATNVLPFVIPIIGVAVGFGLNRGINRQKALYESYTLHFTNNMVIREQLNTPTISIYLNDIKEIVKKPNGSFTIKGKAATDLIIVPAQIENYAQLEVTLSQLKPISTKSNEHFLQKYRVILSLLTIGSMLSVYIVTNRIIVALSGIVFIGLMLWSLFEIQRNKSVDSKTKRRAWVILIVVASIAYIMVLKLTGERKQ